MHKVFSYSPRLYLYWKGRKKEVNAWRREKKALNDDGKIIFVLHNISRENIYWTFMELCLRNSKFNIFFRLSKSHLELVDGGSRNSGEWGIFE